MTMYVIEVDDKLYKMTDEDMNIVLTDSYDEAMKFADRNLADFWAYTLYCYYTARKEEHEVGYISYFTDEKEVMEDADAR